MRRMTRTRPSRSQLIAEATVMVNQADLLVKELGTVVHEISSLLREIDAEGHVSR